MPPADNTNAPTSTQEQEQSPSPEQAAGQSPEPEKKGFWDKLKHLFDKKVAPIEPHYDTENDKPVPVDQIGTDAPTSESAPAEDSSQSSQQTDPQTGAPQAAESSAPDADGDTTAPEVAVPDDLKANPGEETPTVPGAPASGNQFTQPAGSGASQDQAPQPTTQTQQPGQQSPAQQPPQPPAQNQ